MQIPFTALMAMSKRLLISKPKHQNNVEPRCVVTKRRAKGAVPTSCAQRKRKDTLNLTESRPDQKIHLIKMYSSLRTSTFNQRPDELQNLHNLCHGRPIGGYL